MIGQRNVYKIKFLCRGEVSPMTLIVNLKRWIYCPDLYFQRLFFLVTTRILPKIDFCNMISCFSFLIGLIVFRLTAC